MTLRPGLFVDDDSGDGVSQPQDARLALAGLLSGPGVLWGGTVTGTSDAPNMTYQLAAGAFVAARGTVTSDGLYVFTNDSPITLDSGSPAPSSGTRYDLVWVRQKNAFDSDGFDDADSLPAAGVTVGTAASSPSKPYGSIPAGALVVAESSVGTDIADATSAAIAMVAAQATIALPALLPPRIQALKAATNGLIPADGSFHVITGWSTEGTVSAGPVSSVDTMGIASNASGVVTLLSDAVGTYEFSFGVSVGATSSSMTGLAVEALLDGTAFLTVTEGKGGSAIVTTSAGPIEVELTGSNALSFMARSYGDSCTPIGADGIAGESCWWRLKKIS